MAQPIYCDVDDCGQYADVLVTHLENGNVEAFCHAHYFEFIMTMAVNLLPPEPTPSEEEPQQPGEETPATGPVQDIADVPPKPATTKKSK